MGLMSTVSVQTTHTARSNVPSSDPFEVVKAHIQASPMTVAAIANKSGVTQGTIYNWINGHTRRPQISTIEMVLRVLGYRIDIVCTH